MKKYFIFSFFLVLLSIAYGKDNIKKNDIVAKVNNKYITFDEVFKRLYNINGKTVVNQIIQEYLIENEAKRLKIEIIDEDIEKKVNELKKQYKSETDFDENLKKSNITIADLKNEYRKQMLTEQVVTKTENIIVTDDEIKQFFDTNKDKISVPEQFHIMHILVATESEANDIIIALNAGADFSVMAKAKSIDSASKNSGGDIGFFSKGMLLPELDNEILKLKDGEVSPVIKTKLGFHIIKLLEKRPQQIAELNEETRKGIYNTIYFNKINSILPSIVEKLSKNAKIEYFYPSIK